MKRNNKELVLAAIGLKLEIWCGSAGRIGKSISAKFRIYTKCFAFSELTLQMLVYPFQFLCDKDPFLKYSSRSVGDQLSTRFCKSIVNPNLRAYKSPALDQLQVRPMEQPTS